MEYETWYKRISAPFRSQSARRALAVLDKGLVGIIAASYIGLLAYMFATADSRLLRCALVPACAFTAVTLLRVALNRKRPYEEHDIDPLIQKDTKGKSMPSRHLASAVVISCALAYAWLPAAIPAFASCIVVAFTRIVGGVHYPADVVVAAMISLSFGAVGFCIVA